MTDSTAYSQYVPANERPVITALIKALLDDGCKLAVHNGEEWASKKTSKLTAIRPALGQTGEDTIRIWDENGEKAGYFYLIYDNGSEHDPMTVIADYTVSERNERIWGELAAKYDD